MVRAVASEHVAGETPGEHALDELYRGHEPGLRRHCLRLTGNRDAADDMDGGAIIEDGPPEHFFTAPTHERTKQFLAKIL
jgi:hypothetical protein